MLDDRAKVLLIMSQDALDRARATYQREVVAATFAKLTTEGDHCHARRVDPLEAAQIENDPVYAFFAEALDLRFQHVSRAVIQLARQAQRMGPGAHAGEPQVRFSRGARWLPAPIRAALYLHHRPS